jgi:hypothetical protein
MPDHNLHPDTIAVADMPQLAITPLLAEPVDCRLDGTGKFLAPLRHAIASWHRRYHRGGKQVIVRFHNGYGTIISEYRSLEGIYEIAPLRFNGPGPDDYEFYFRSHVPDLTWSSTHDEIVQVCAQISRLLPPSSV